MHVLAADAMQLSSEKRMMVAGPDYTRDDDAEDFHGDKQSDKQETNKVWARD